MKYCIYCGDPMEVHARFCSRCGADTGNADTNLPVLGDAPMVPPGNAISVQNYFRSLCTSRLGISFTIVTCLQWLVSLCAAFWPIQALGLDPEMIREYIDVDQLTRTYSITMLVSMIPSTLIIVGILMTVIRAYRPASAPNKNGTRLIIILYKVSRVLYPVLLGLASFALVTACSRFGTTYYNLLHHSYIGQQPSIDQNTVTALRAAMGIIVLILWGGCVFSVFYYHKVIRTLESVVRSIESNRPLAEISMFVVVMCFIAGGISASSLFGSGLVGFELNGLNAAMQILAGFILLSIRKNISLPAKFHTGMQSRE